MLVLVTGSRSWTDVEKVREVFTNLPDHFRLLHGGAKGLDTIAGEVYKEMTGQHALVERPDYDKYYFKVAPLKRNGTMLDMVERARGEGEEVLVIAFKHLDSPTNGTNACLEGAELRQLPVKVYYS